MYEININKGLGKIQFGMHPGQVKAILGNNLYYEDWMGGNLESFLFYKGLLIGFSGPSTNEPAEESIVSMFHVKASHELILEKENITRHSPKEVERMLKTLNIEYKYLSKLILQTITCGLQFNFNTSETLESVHFSSKNS